MASVPVVFFVAVITLTSHLRCSSEEQQVVNLFIPENADIIIVSFEKRWRELDNVLARNLQMKQSWIFNTPTFRQYMLKSATTKTKIVAIISSFPVPFHDFPNYLKFRRTYLDVHWLLIQKQEWLDPMKKVYEDVSIVPKVSIIRVHMFEQQFVAPKLVFTRNHSFSNTESVNDSTSSSLVMEQERRLSGQPLRLGCRNSASEEKIPNFCQKRQYKFFIKLLQLQNASLILEHFYDLKEACWRLWLGELDMLVLNMALESTCMLDFARIEVIAETFYTRANGTRVISFFEILSSSAPGVALTVSCVALCALLLAAMNSGRSFSKSAFVEITFLLATLFAQSSPIPRHHRHAGSRRVIYLFLLLGLFPLSVYIRGELTSCITVTRPVNYLDTLDELGRALDDGTVAACAAKGTSQAKAMTTRGQGSSSSIMRKLQ
ncbi:hypothetical protein MTO96_044739, partial [Rhipicephalus appendiculatus]